MSKGYLIVTILFIIGLGLLFFRFQNQPAPAAPKDNLTLQYSGEVNSDLTTERLNSQQTTDQTALPTAPETTIDPNLLATSAEITTSKGKIVLELYPQEAPKTVANFVQKAKSGFYENLLFHRVEGWVIQGGDPEGNGTGGGNMPVEFNDKPFVVGSLGVASRGDNVNQNDAQFFITKEDATHLNGKYTNYGIVTEGMDIVNQIEIGDKIVSITVE